MPQQIFNKPQYKDRRIELRKNPTEPEKLLWQHIRNQQLGVKFRRQHGVGDYILDFFAKEINLAVEIDGDSHFTNEGIAYDNIRTEFLNALNIDVIRFTNQEVMQNVLAVCEILTSVINERLAMIQETPSNSPLSGGRIIRYSLKFRLLTVNLALIVFLQNKGRLPPLKRGGLGWG